jgi:hypothetical protein
MSLRGTLVLAGGILLTSLVTPKTSNLENILIQESSAQTILTPGSYSNIDVSTPEKAFDVAVVASEQKDKNLFRRVIPGFTDKSTEEANSDIIYDPQNVFNLLDEYRPRVTGRKNLSKNLAVLELYIPNTQKYDFIFAIKEGQKWTLNFQTEYGYTNEIRNFLISIDNARYLRVMNRYIQQFNGTVPQNLLRELPKNYATESDRNKVCAIHEFISSLSDNQKRKIIGIDKQEFPLVLKKYLFANVGATYFNDKNTPFWSSAFNVPEGLLYTAGPR